MQKLEDRWLLATFTVTNNTDGGPGSLRQAILDSNANAGSDSIDFNIEVGAIAEEQPLSSPPNGNFFGITVGPDDNLWFTENFRQRKRRTPNLQRFIHGIPHFLQVAIPLFRTSLPAPTATSGSTQTPKATGGILRLTTDGTVTEFPVPTAFSVLSLGITSGPDGNLWFPEDQWQFNIGRITPTGTITEFSHPNGQQPARRHHIPARMAISGSRRDNVSKIGRVTPAGTITVVRDFGYGGAYHSRSGW